eukprot:4399722-Alexandrium_andersonii.AAC.1
MEQAAGSGSGGAESFRSEREESNDDSGKIPDDYCSTMRDELSEKPHDRLQCVASVDGDKYYELNMMDEKGKQKSTISQCIKAEIN